MSAYTCPTCGAKFSGPYIRCIGVAGTHPPAFPAATSKRFGA